MPGIIRDATLIDEGMDCTLRREDFANLVSYWEDPAQRRHWDSVFVLPAWLEVWWREFGAGAELYLAVVWRGDTIIGVAPLKIEGGNASFLGSPDVCDYQDFIIVPGEEETFFSVLLADLKARGIELLELGDVRPEATVLSHLKGMVEKRGGEVSCYHTGVSPEMALPSTWEEYLEGLDSKQRHEVGRKLRRLYEAGAVRYRYTDGKSGLDNLLGVFFHLFSLSRGDKADFMTEKMAYFFRSLAGAMAGLGLLRFGILEIDEKPVAATLGFDYGDKTYLYNSAYDPQYRSLSVGLLSKALCIRESIESGKKIFDFLKGDEVYKYHLGGRKVPLYKCRIKLGR